VGSDQCRVGDRSGPGCHRWSLALPAPTGDRPRALASRAGQAGDSVHDASRPTRGRGRVVAPCRAKRRPTRSRQRRGSDDIITPGRARRRPIRGGQWRGALHISRVRTRSLVMDSKHQRRSTSKPRVAQRTLGMRPVTGIIRYAEDVPHQSPGSRSAHWVCDRDYCSLLCSPSRSCGSGSRRIRRSTSATH
jgi:hypothetical protein